MTKKESTKRNLFLSVFDDINSAFNNFNSEFDGFHEVKSTYHGSRLHNIYSHTTKTSVETDNSSKKITVEVPGLSSEDVDVSLHDRKIEVTYKDKCHAFTVEDFVDREKISAEVKNGLLTIMLPYRQRDGTSEVKKILVK